MADHIVSAVPVVVRISIANVCAQIPDVLAVVIASQCECACVPVSIYRYSQRQTDTLIIAKPLFIKVNFLIWVSVFE